MAQLPVKGAMKVPEVRKGDTIVVLAGKDAGKRGVVDRVLRNPLAGARKRGSIWKGVSSLAETAVVVEGLNIAKRHTKPRQSTSTTDRMPKVYQGGIVDVAKPMPASKVMVVCPSCDRPTRIRHATLDNGERVRVCRHCGERIEVKA